jgi:uncharacterized protein
MTQSRNALVLFTKSPQPGRTKTRLTRKFGGPLSDEEAAGLYHAMMLDVAEVAGEALASLRKTASGDNMAYDLVVSCSPEDEKQKLRTIFESELTYAAEIRYINDQGATFDDHLNDAYRQLFEQGYHSVVCVGGDLPTLSSEFIQRSFQWLAYLEAQSDRGALVIAPCQEAGVSLIGLTADAPMDFTGVFYDMNGVSALEAITGIAASRQIPMGVLEVLADVDTQQDLAHALAVINALSYAGRFQPAVAVPARTLAWLRQTGIIMCTPPNDAHDPRETGK